MKKRKLKYETTIVGKDGRPMRVRAYLKTAASGVKYLSLKIDEVKASASPSA